MYILTLDLYRKKVNTKYTYMCLYDSVIVKYIKYVLVSNYVCFIN